jgi:ABC-type multidrug transport system fused ATPase/permease subunit
MHVPLLQSIRRKGLRQIGQSVRHARVTAWLLRDFFGFLGWGGLPIVLAGAASVAVKFGAAGLLYLFVDALAGQHTVQVPGLTDLNIDLRDFFVVGVVVGLLLMAVSTLLQFQVRLSAIRAAREYEEFSTRRFVALVSGLPHRDAGWANEVYKTEPLQGFLGGIRSAAMVVRQVTRLLPSLASFVLGCILLVWLNPTSTAALAAVALVVMAAQYPLNNRAAHASTKSQGHRREASRRLGQLFGQLRQAPVPLAPDGAVLNALFERRGALRRDMKSFSRRADGGVFALMVSRLGTHLLLGMVLLTLGLDIIAGRQTWASVAAYVAIVQFTLRDFLSIGKLLSGVSRFFGQVDRYMRFIRSAAPAIQPAATPSAVVTSAAATSAGREPGAPAGATRKVPTLAVPSMDGARPTFTPAEGSVVALFAPPGSPPFATLFLDAVDATPGEIRLPAGIDATIFDRRIPLVENVALPASADQPAIEQLVSRFAPPATRPPRPGWLMRTPGSFRDGVPDWLVAALKVVAARQRGFGCLVIQAGLLAELPPTWHAACREMLDGGVLYVLHTGAATIGRFEETAALIADSERFICWTSFEAQRVVDVQRFCRDVAERSKAKALAEAEDAALLLEE